MTGIGLAPQAEPTARAAPGLARRPAISPYERVWPGGMLSSSTQTVCWNSVPAEMSSGGRRRGAWPISSDSSAAAVAASQRLAKPVGFGADLCAQALPGKSSRHRPMSLNCATKVPCRVAMGAALVIAAEDQRDGDGDDRRDDGDGNPDGNFVSQFFGSRLCSFVSLKKCSVLFVRRFTAHRSCSLLKECPEQAEQHEHEQHGEGEETVARHAPLVTQRPQALDAPGGEEVDHARVGRDRRFAEPAAEPLPQSFVFRFARAQRLLGEQMAGARRQRLVAGLEFVDGGGRFGRLVTGLVELLDLRLQVCQAGLERPGPALEWILASEQAHGGSTAQL